jgi:hypothetical protein
MKKGFNVHQNRDWQPRGGLSSHAIGRLSLQLEPGKDFSRFKVADFLSQLVLGSSSLYKTARVYVAATGLKRLTQMKKRRTSTGAGAEVAEKTW